MDPIAEEEELYEDVEYIDDYDDEEGHGEDGHDEEGPDEDGHDEEGHDEDEFYLEELDSDEEYDCDYVFVFHSTFQ
ncbi:acidic leucine-rich nuclear phosphoprotein 32 family member E-like isoform X2 [Drosophila kikkawai]|nr:acidic leucine-rich nuclear phosphoprotein 32 family member E-like isoform X2 [Drosophila kikkawai]